MPRRLMRRSMAPRRPILFAQQWPLALVTAAFALAGAGFVAWVLLLA